MTSGQPVRAEGFQVGMGTKGGIISPPADADFLPSFLSHWILEVLQRQQQAAVANCSEIASLHFRVLPAFALVAGK